MKVAIAIFTLFFLLYVLPLNVRPLAMPDETRYSEIGREIVETGNWIVPQLNGLRYFEKPILGHWVHALSIKLLGANAFAVRLPSALAVGLSAIVATLMILLVLHQTMPAGSRLYKQQETWKVVLVATAFLTWVMFLHYAGRAADFRKKLAYFAVGPAVFMFCAHFVIPGQLIEEKTPGKFLRQYKNRIGQDTILVSDNYLAAAVCWSYKRNDVYLLGRAGELAYGLEYDDSKHRLLDVDRLRDLITENSGKGCVTLVTSTRRYIEYEHLLLKPAFKDINHGFLFAEFGTSVAEGSVSLEHTQHQ